MGLSEIDSWTVVCGGRDDGGGGGGTGSLCVRVLSQVSLTSGTTLTPAFVGLSDMVGGLHHMYCTPTLG
jgi:hypothetical protein